MSWRSPTPLNSTRVERRSGANVVSVNPFALLAGAMFGLRRRATARTREAGAR